jgi:hypothetical protein
MIHLAVLSLVLATNPAPGASSTAIESVSEPGDTLSAFGFDWSIASKGGEMGMRTLSLLGTKKGIEAHRFDLGEYHYGGVVLWLADVDGAAGGGRELIVAESATGSGAHTSGARVFTSPGRSSRLVWSGKGETTLVDLDGDGVAELVTGSTIQPLGSPANAAQRYSTRVLSWRGSTLVNVTAKHLQVLSADVEQARADAKELWRADLCTATEEKVGSQRETLHSIAGVLVYAALHAGDLRRAQREVGEVAPCLVPYKAVQAVWHAMLREDKELATGD